MASKNDTLMLVPLFIVIVAILLCYIAYNRFVSALSHERGDDTDAKEEKESNQGLLVEGKEGP